MQVRLVHVSRFVFVMAMLTLAVRAEAAPVSQFGDIQAWAGSGTNASALVLQFSGSASPTAIAWGYRWSGTSATMQDMVYALVGTTTVTGGTAPAAGLDGRLTLEVQQYSFGAFVNRISYDQVGLPPGAWSQVLRTIEPYDEVTGLFPAQYQLDAAAGAWTGASFALSNFGMADTPLVAGGWYGFVSGTGDATFAFTQPVSAVPEPATWALLAGAAVAIGCRLGARRHAR